MGKNVSLDMTNGGLLGKIIIFTIPVILSNVIQFMFNAADTVIVGRYAGSSSLAAVGSTTPIVNFLINLFIGLSIGANAVTARFIGKGDEEGVRETVHTALVLGLVSGIILVFIGFIFTKPILVLMGSPSNVIDKSAVYLRIYFAGMPATMIYNFGSAILRAFGDTKRPLFYLTAAGAVNVVLNLFFVIVLNMDVAGVGLATVISQCLAAFLVLKCFVKSNEMYKLCFSKLKIYSSRLVPILKTGIPSGISSMVFSFSNIIIQSSVNSFGSAVMAGNSAASSIEYIPFITMNSFSHAALTFTSQNFGAGKTERIKKVFFSCIALVSAVGLSIGLLVCFNAEALAGIYSSDPEIIKYAVVRLTLVCPLYFMLGAADSVTGVLRGIGYAFVSMCISIICICGIRMLFIFTYFQANRTYLTLYYSYPISWAAALFVECIFFIYAYKKIKRV